jgi:hypothetical protein
MREAPGFGLGKLRDSQGFAADYCDFTEEPEPLRNHPDWDKK